MVLQKVYTSLQLLKASHNTYMKRVTKEFPSPDPQSHPPAGTAPGLHSSPLMAWPEPPCLVTLHCNRCLLT